MASIGVVFCAGKGWGGEWGGTTEAKFRRATTQQSVLSSLAGGRGVEVRWYCDVCVEPPATTYCTACPAKGLCSCVLLAIAAAAAAGRLPNVHRTPKSPKSRSVGRGQSSMYTARWVALREEKEGRTGEPKTSDKRLEGGSKNSVLC